MAEWSPSELEATIATLSTHQSLAQADTVELIGEPVRTTDRAVSAFRSNIGVIAVHCEGSFGMAAHFFQEDQLAEIGEGNFEKGLLKVIGKFLHLDDPLQFKA